MDISNKETNKQNNIQTNQIQKYNKLKWPALPVEENNLILKQKIFDFNFFYDFWEKKFIFLLWFYQYDKFEMYIFLYMNVNPRIFIIRTLFFLDTVKPLIKNTSKEFFKCRLYNFSMSFILYYGQFQYLRK